jgi:hypothetical protein
MPGTWTAPANPAGFDVGLALLLTDGTVLAQERGTAHWWRLTPDAAGDYANGRWTQLASAHTPRLYYASAVLNDGTVFIAGGEYTTDPNTASDTTLAEQYDPPTDRWTQLSPPAGWAVIGDAPNCVLPDGSVLLGNINTGQCARFDPAARSFTATGTKLNASASEESWTLLPDGSVLTADCIGHPRSERFVAGTWRDEGIPPGDLVEAVSTEIGPALLLPDGRVFAAGATGNTAFFTPAGTTAAPGAWAVGPQLPQNGGKQLAAKDAPACLLPSGTVLLALSAVDGSQDDYGNSSLLFEFDGHTYTPVTLPAPVPYGAYKLTMLLLPNGTVMLTKPDGPLFYQPTGTPRDSWRPTVTQTPAQLRPGIAYAVYGTQFNGLSQACAYGDDISQATNYPLVRLRAAPGGPNDGAVHYCRTFGHSTMGVATGDTLCSTSFTVPAGLPPGEYSLCVVANAIASADVPVTVQAAGLAAPPPAAAAAGDPDEVSKRNAELQQEMFWRDLNEVHLLMEFIQGRPDKSLTDLKDIVRPGTSATPPTLMTPNEVVHEVSKVRFPPDGSPEEKARQAELLLMVKDKLNAIASPARGLSVAYTSMFSGVALPPPVDSPEARLALATPGAKGTHRNKYSSGFAAEAYPNLEGHARNFQAFYKDLPAWALLWLAFTAAVYWDVGFSQDVLLKAAPTQACFLRNQPELASVFVDRWALHPVGWFVHAFGTAGGQAPAEDAACSQTGPTKVDAPAPGASVPPAETQTLMAVFNLANSVVAVSTKYVVPMMFGFLGTLAGLVRSISAKVRDSTLFPRDLRLSWSLLPLGAVAGLAVGLFLAPAASNGDVASAGGSGIPNTLSLNGAALAFLAGYGAEAFFTLLDAILKKVFTFDATDGGKGGK